MSRLLGLVVMAILVGCGTSGEQWPPATWDGTWAATEVPGSAAGDPSTACQDSPIVASLEVAGRVVTVNTATGEAAASWTVAADQDHATISVDGLTHVSGWWLIDAELARCDMDLCGKLRWLSADNVMGQTQTAWCARAFSFHQEL